MKDKIKKFDKENVDEVDNKYLRIGTKQYNRREIRLFFSSGEEESKKVDNENDRTKPIRFLSLSLSQFAPLLLSFTSYPFPHFYNLIMNYCRTFCLPPTFSPSFFLSLPFSSNPLFLPFHTPRLCSFSVYMDISTSLPFFLAPSPFLSRVSDSGRAREHRS